MFKKNVFLSHINWQGTLSIKDSEFKESLKITLLDNIIEETYNLSIEVESTKFEKSLNIERVSDIIDENIHSIQSFVVNASSKLSGSINVKNVSIDKADFKGNFTKDTNMVFDNIRYNSINFNGNLQKDGSIILKNTKSNEVNLEGNLQKDATLLFDVLNTNSLSFQNFVNQGNIQFNSLKPLSDKPKKITIIDSDLGNTRFFNAKFNRFKAILIYHANLSQIVSADCKWFAYEQLELKKTDSTEKPFEVQREVFRQLKYAMEKQGDRIQSLVFKQYEMQSYRSYLESLVTKPDSDKKNPVKHIKKILYWLNLKFGNKERIILTLGSTNDFGQNWVKPIKYLLGFSLFFYCLIVLSIHTTLVPSCKFEDLKSCFCNLTHDFKLFPQMLNPTLTISKMEGIEIEKKDISGWTHTFDFIHKIVLSFFIYQIITAFRKYSGKSD